MACPEPKQAPHRVLPSLRHLVLFSFLSPYLISLFFQSLLPHSCENCNNNNKKMMILSRLFQLRLRLLVFLYCFCALPFDGLVAVQAFTGTYGVNYGRIADNIPSPEAVVTLLKAAKIKNVKIFNADHKVLNAFKGAGLELFVMVPNELLKDMSANEDRAMQWIKENVQQFFPDTNIRGIAVGNEILGGPDEGLSEALLGAIKNVYSSLDRIGLARSIEVSTPHSEAVFASAYPPSSCTFKEDVFVYMRPMLEFFLNTSAHFYINAYPFLAYKSDPEHIDINYALFKPNSGIYDEKTNLHYSNMFDAQVDAAYAALEAAGFDKMEVLVSETGWASTGDQDEAGATLKNAKTYNFNLHKRLLKKKGTPMRPKIPVKAYVFALFNEDLKPGPTSERHFGLFKADGSIAYNMGFPGLRSSAPSPSFLCLIVYILSFFTAHFSAARMASWIVHFADDTVLTAEYYRLFYHPASGIDITRLRMGSPAF